MPTSFETGEAALAALFERAGYARANPALLQPADSFLELSGEDLRRRLYLTNDAQGQELCLRPEFTIPVCRAYLEGSQRSIPAQYWYCGPVFRHRNEGKGEFIQAGIESLGRKDRAAADAETIDMALQACQALGATNPHVAIGDVGLIEALLAALALPADMVRRLRKGLAAGREVSAVLEGAVSGAGTSLSEYGAVLKALEGVDRRQARAFIEDVLSIAGLQAVGGRSVGDIAERFLARTGAEEQKLPRESRDLIARFLDLAGSPDSVSAEARQLTEDAGVDIAAALDEFDMRTGFMAARGLDVGSIDARTAFSRNLDYYTGFVFEIGDTAGAPLVAGGRYDRLLTRLGASEAIPAVGCSIWLERFGNSAGDSA